MDKLYKALYLRGFLVRLESDHIYFSKGNYDGELEQLIHVLNELGCNVRKEDRKIYPLDNHIDETILEKITWYPARNHEAGGGSGWRSWKYFVKRHHGPKINTFVLETGVAFLIKALSAAGIVTVSSCDGHGEKSPVITFCRKHNAIWFKILFEEMKGSKNLHYNWNIDRKERVDIDFVSKSLTDQWSLNKVLEDTLQMGEYFYSQAEYLSNIKQEIFGSNLQSTKKYVKTLTFEEMEDWMRGRYQSFIKESVK